MKYKSGKKVFTIFDSLSALNIYVQNAKYGKWTYN